METLFSEGRDGGYVFLVDFVDLLNVVNVYAMVAVVYFDWNVLLAHFYFSNNYYNTVLRIRKMLQAHSGLTRTRHRSFFDWATQLLWFWPIAEQISSWQ